MPSGSGSGIVHSVSFTPGFTGDIEVTCSYRAFGQGSGLGQVRLGKLFRTQSAATVYSDGRSLPRNQEVAHVDRHIFSVTSGSSVEVGLYGDISGAVAATWYDIAISVRAIQ